MPENKREVKAVPMSDSNRDPWDERWVIADVNTGQVLDDAHGYGYKSAQKAYAAWNYKTRSPEQKARAANAKQAVRKFVQDHEEFVADLNNEAYYAIQDGTPGEFNASYVASRFREAGFTNLPFTAKEFLKYW